MNILLLCDHYPQSYRQGLTLRILNFAEKLSKHHAIDLLCLGDSEPASPTRSFFRNCWMAAAPAKQGKGWLRDALNWDPEDYYPRSHRCSEILANQLKPEDYDVVWDAGGRMFLHLPERWRDVPLVVDLVDDTVLTLRRALKESRGWVDRLRARKYLHIQKRYENECMRRAFACCVVSEDDADSFKAVSPHVPVHVIQNGVDAAYFQPDHDAIEPGLLVFEGTMSFPPNEQAAMFLVREILPALRKARPDIRLMLVGRDPPAAVRALASPHVEVTGEVDDVRTFVARAELFVCPLMMGAGIKNKLLQAWAMGKAVVATPLSIGGLDAEDGVNLLVRDGVDDFVAGVLMLLGDPDLRDRLGANGRSAVEQRFMWDARARQFESLLREAVRDRATQRP